MKLHRNLGSQGLRVSSLGLGCMGMSWSYGAADEAESMRTLKRALELGINFWDTAEIYGPFTNEELLGRAMKLVSREDVVIATKFAWEIGPTGERVRLNSSPSHIKHTIEGSLQRLGTDYIDLYYQHRLDPNVPIEDTVGAMSELVKEGKVRYIGLSEVSADIARRAHAVHPLTAVQSEYSLWERSIEETVLPTLRELGIGFVPYSPMGRGFLTGQFAKRADIGSDDSRSKNFPRFSEENFEHNMSLVRAATAFAEQHGATPAQVALGWLLRQGEDIVPIPGTKRVKYLEENAQSTGLEISDEDWAAFDDLVRGFVVAGDRYNSDGMKLVYRG